MLLEGFKRALVQFSRIPLTVDWRDDVKHVPPLAMLPWVGALIALISAWPLLLDISSALQALLMLLSAVLLTGAFHEDGLMDACDGLVGGWQTEQRLTIMKDSRIGSYAAVAIWFSLSLKWLLLTELMATTESAFVLLIAWCATHTLARLLPLCIRLPLPYVTAGNSKAIDMLSDLTRWHWLIACLPALLLAWLLPGVPIIALILTLLALMAGIAWYLQQKIGGYNGDTLGAAEQLGEIGFLLLLRCLL